MDHSCRKKPDKIRCILRCINYKDCSSKFHSKHSTGLILCLLLKLLEQPLEFKIETVKLYEERKYRLHIHWTKMGM